MLESKFKKDFLKEVDDIFPSCVILKNDPTFMPGVPDTIILWNDRWAMLEFKNAKGAAKQPNQSYYVELLNAMSFAAFVYPENRNEVLDALQESFGAGREACISVSEQLPLA